VSRIGKAPILLPSGVEVKADSNHLVTVKGPKGVLTLTMKYGITLKIEDNVLTVERDEKSIASSFHGLYRALIQNMVTGVTKGFEKQLSLVGVGFRAAVKGRKIDLQLGYSHPTELEIPEGLEVKVNKSTEIIVSGSDKQRIGQFAAEIRSMRPVEPYKGKGIRYTGEYVRKKAGKAAKGK